MDIVSLIASSLSFKALTAARWRLSRNEPPNANFSKDDPDLSPQLLKLFVEDYIVTREHTPTQKTVCSILICFVSRWERETSRSLPEAVKEDVLNVRHPLFLLFSFITNRRKYIRTALTTKYGLPTRPRERFLVTAKDIELLLRYLFVNDTHEYVYERARVQTGTGLSLFAGSGVRAGAIVESSSYRGTNECLYYRVCWCPFIIT